MAEATTTGRRGHEPRDFVRRLARCSVFKDRFVPARRDSRAARSARRRPLSISTGAGWPGDVSRFRPPQPLVAALADLEHLAIELRTGHVEPSGLQHFTADPDSPLVDQATRLAARQPKVLRQERRQVDRPVWPTGIHNASSTSSGTSLRTCSWSKRASAAAAASAPWKRSTRRRASSRSASPGCRSGSARRRAEAVVLAHHPVRKRLISFPNMSSGASVTPT